MTNIELIIKIPKEVYEHILKAKSVPDVLGIDIVNTINAVKNGTSIPKGHGRLIDADAFIKQESCCGYIEDMDIDYFKQNVPTIIEADKENE